MKITGYGPWTLTLGSDREHELQILQASLYQKIQRFFSEKNCLVFRNRSDEYFAITNGMSLEDHVDIQKELQALFEIKISRMKALRGEEARTGRVRNVSRPVGTRGIPDPPSQSQGGAGVAHGSTHMISP